MRQGKPWRGVVGLGYGVQAFVIAVATDIAEVVGGALALHLMFGTPLWLGGVIVGLVSVLLLWALRLGSHLAVRLIGHAEDARYTAIRRNNDPGFWWKSLGIVFWFQGALVCVVSLVTLAAIGAVTATGWLAWVGIAVATIGVLIEGVADVQLTRWKRLPESAGQVMRSGLWRYSRHPNYFGNFVLWWGLGLTALDVAAWLSLIGPAIMSILLLRVSGVALLEKTIGERRPKYADYIRTTPAFFSVVAPQS